MSGHTSLFQYWLFDLANSYYLFLIMPSFVYSQYLPLSGSCFLFICFSFYLFLMDTRKRSGCSVSGQIFRWGGFSQEGVYCVFLCTEASGDERWWWWCFTYKLEGFPPTSAQMARSIFIYRSCKTTKVWNMPQRVYLIVQFTMTTMHRSQRCLGVVVWSNWWL